MPKALEVLRKGFERMRKGFERMRKGFERMRRPLGALGRRHIGSGGPPTRSRRPFEVLRKPLAGLREPLARLKPLATTKVSRATAGRLVLFAVVVASLASYYFFIVSASGYYTYLDMFGPLSRSDGTTVSLVVFVVSTWLLMRSLGHLSSSPRRLCVEGLLVAFFVLAKFVIPNVADAYYSQSFYDAAGHMVQGAYVTFTGHSSPSVDNYFDLQPGFSWATAIFVDVIYGTPSSFSSPMFQFLIKWFEVVSVLTYIPVVYLLLRNYGLSADHSFLGLIVFFGLTFGHYHYAANSWGNALFWLLLALLPKYMSRNDRRLFALLTLTFVSIIFVHEGVTFFSLVAILAMMLMAVTSRSNRVQMQRAGYSLLRFVVIWLVYLLYVARFQLGAVVGVVNEVTTTYLFEGVAQPVAQGLSRSYAPWTEVVFTKAIFMLVVIVVPLVLLLYGMLRMKDPRAKLPFFLVLVTTIIVGPISVALGGAGYIERIPSELLPVLSMAFLGGLAFSKKRYRTVLLQVLVISLLLAGTAFYFSGRNFQSTAYSENAAVFSLNFQPGNQPPGLALYSGLRIQSIWGPLETGGVYAPSQPYAFFVHEEIQTMYYGTGSLAPLQRYVTTFADSQDVVYSTPTSMLVFTR